MIAKEFIVAIELGSSKITGIAGKKTNDGSIQVLAYTSEDASDCIRKGLIYNINKTAIGLTSVVNELESQLEVEIAKVYVGIGGQSLHSIMNFVVEHLSTETVISKEDVQHLNDSNLQTRYKDLEILDVVPQEYKVKNKLLDDPVGVMGSQIEGHFLNIVARTSVKRNILTCFEQAEIEIAGFIIAPMALADVVLTDVEKRSGCVLVDFGYDTTTVEIYKDRILRHLAVIPLGSNNITKDICSLQIEDGEAETLKCKYGSAFTMPGVNTDDDEYPVNDTRKIKAKLLNEIVSARVEEIVANVLHQITLSGYENKLFAGIIVTGGGSNLRNLQDAFKQQKNDYVKVRIASFVIPDVKCIDSDILMKDGRRNTIFALLAAGKENCAAPEKVINGGKDLFTQKDEDEAQQQATEDFNRQVEEAKALAAAEEKKKQEQLKKEEDERETQINNNAKKELAEAASAIVQSLERVNEAMKKMQQAATDKNVKAAQQISLTADNLLKEAMTTRKQASEAMERITIESFLAEARITHADIEDKYKAVEKIVNEIRESKDEVKRQNNWWEKVKRTGKRISDEVMNDDI